MFTEFSPVVNEPTLEFIVATLELRVVTLAWRDVFTDPRFAVVAVIAPLSVDVVEKSVVMFAPWFVTVLWRVARLVCSVEMLLPCDISDALRVAIVLKSVVMLAEAVLEAVDRDAIVLF